MSVVKTYQHKKAIGNARSTVRGAYVPVLRDVSGQDVFGQVTNPYGPEKATATGTLSVDLDSGLGIIAMGRLERMSAEAVEKDVRLSNKEAYRLYWLPFAWDHQGGDYEGNPQKIGTEVNPSSPQTVDFVLPGSRVWIVLDADGLDDLGGRKAWEFTVVDSFRNGIGDVVEYEATVYRSEAVNPREVAVV
jgi:hypothetical protein